MKLARTICDCDICKKNCMIIPGYLIPSDIEKIKKYIEYANNIFQFCKDYLLASPGAIVMKENKIYRIPTLVPARNVKGYCIFFSDNEKCMIHPVSPFGCKYFDHKQTKEQGDTISVIGLNLIIQSKEYLNIWKTLNNKGLTSKGPEHLRQEFNKEEEV